MLQCKAVGVSYGPHRVLNEISFSLRAGEFTAVLGKNGCGKSTLASAVGGVIPYSGEILTGGRELRTFSARERARRIALLPQVLPSASVSVRELVGFGRNPYLGLNRRFSDEDRNAVESAMRRTGVDPLADRMLPTLSGGERQRAYLSMILAQDAEVLILDEPTTYMDIYAESVFLKLLRELSAEGKTLMVVLHQLSLAVKYADRILILERGEQKFEGTRDECLGCGAIEQAFSVRRSVLPETGEIIFTA